MIFLGFYTKYRKAKEKWEATGEATGRPLWRPLGGHWEATAKKRTSCKLLEVE
jgi:hypothetical protein